MKRIFMVSSYPLFCEGIAALLQRKDELELVGRETDVERAIHQIQLLHPDTVIVDSDNTVCETNSIVTRILQEETKIKIVRLNLHDNAMCVLHEEHRSIRDVEDLMTAIVTDEPVWINQKGE